MKSRSLPILTMALTLAVTVHAQDTTFIFDAGTYEERYIVEFADGTIEKGQMKDGEKHGLIHTYFANGVLQTAAEYSKGVRNGWYLQCETNGVVLKEEHYRNGLLDGEVREYYTAKGVRIVKSVYSYMEGRYHGVCSEYNDMGKLVSQAKYKEGIKDGVSKWYFQNGNLAMEQNYSNGALDGIQKVYAQDGKLLSDGSFSDNKKSGLWKEYYPNGLLKEEGHYLDDAKTGEWTYYNEDGSFDRTESY